MFFVKSKPYFFIKNKPNVQLINLTLVLTYKPNPLPVNLLINQIYIYSFSIKKFIKID